MICKYCNEIMEVKRDEELKYYHCDCCGNLEKTNPDEAKVEYLGDEN